MISNKRKLLPIVLMFLCICSFLLPGCGKKATEQASPGEPRQEIAAAEQTSTEQTSAEQTSAEQTSTEQASVEQTNTENVIDEDGIYTTRDDVALYIHIYGKLPGNFITKKEAKKLGWSGGSLEEYAPGKCIGGDYFGNYEGLLPEDAEYHECDIDTLGKKKRGSKRIIYSDDGYIYYTEDHYESFEKLYGPE